MKQDERRVWEMDHEGYPDSKPHRELDPKCPVCAESGPFEDWTRSYQTQPDPEVNA